METKVVKVYYLNWFIVLSKPNQTRYGLSPVYVDSETQKKSAAAYLWKKLGFRTESCDYFK